MANKWQSQNELIKKEADDFSQEQKDYDITLDLDHQKKIDKVVLELCEKHKYEIMRCVNCPIVLECSYPMRRLEVLKADAEKMAKGIYDEELELDNSTENILRAKEKQKWTYNSFIQNNAYTVLKNDRCVFERQEILQSISKFVEAGYDISDPRTFMIVNELIGNLLNSGRMNKAFTNLGVIMRKDTPAGPIYYANPLLKTKIEFSKLIVESTQILDQMLKTDKEDAKAGNFTQHLLQGLKIREKKKKIAFREEEKLIEASKEVEAQISREDYNDNRPE